MRDPAVITVLTIDGNTAHCGVTADILRQAGFAVQEAGTGAEALRLAAGKPDLIVLNVNLPDLSGPEICRRLRADAVTTSIPVLYLEADAATEAVLRGMAGASAYLAMPVGPADLVGTVRALLDARQTEERAWAASRQWQALFDSLGDGVALLDPEGRFLRCNQALANLVGKPFAEIIGRPYHALVPSPLACGPDRPFPRMLQSQHREMAELELDGRWFRVTADPVFAPAGALVGAVYILADITEQVATRRRIEELAAQAEAKSQALAASDRRKDAFLALLAHELRNPLAPLRNALHLIGLRGHDSAAVAQARELAERQVRQLARLVDDLLDASRIAQGKLQLRKERVDVGQVVGQAVETVRPLVEARHHHLTVLLPPAPLQLEADPARLVQIVVNLLTNAVRYTEPGGHIWVTAEGAENEVLLSVRDTGVGLPADLLPRVFDLFVQAVPGAQGGLGIGLNLVHGLVELHGGSVIAISDGPGEGSEFVVRLPALSEQPAAKPPAAPKVNGPAARPLRVLVVDDDIDGAESMALLLRLWGHEVQVAHDGLAALETARSYQPEVVLLDLGLPGGLSGFEVAPRLRQEAGLTHTLVIALTGWGQDEDRRRSREAGVDYHFVKPMPPQTLRDLLARLGISALKDAQAW